MLQNIKNAFLFYDGMGVILSIPIGLLFEKIISFLIQKSSFHEILLPLISFGVLTILYWAVCFINLSMAFVFNKRFNEKKKSVFYVLWDFAGIFLVETVFFVCCILFHVFGFDLLYRIFSLAIIFLYVIVIGFNIILIGENQKKITGKKSRVFVFIEKVFNTMENVLFSVLLKLLGIKNK